MTPKNTRPISIQSGSTMVTANCELKSARRYHMGESLRSPRGAPARGTMDGPPCTTDGRHVIELRTPAEIEQMKPAGAFVAQVLTTVREAAAVGVDLLRLDAIAAEMIRKAGAKSSYVDYHPSFGAMPFGKVLCTSVNDAVLHGLPHAYRLKDGDLLTLDFACELNGWVADSAVSFIVGTPRAADVKIIETTELALAA